MTDNLSNNLSNEDIKKALECCTTNGASCKDCPAFVKVDRSNCKKYFRGALDLINRLQENIKHLDNESDALLADIDFRDKELKRLRAENERLKKGWKADAIRWIIADAKAEAYKEFAERLHEELRMYGIKDKFNKSVFLNIADKVKKEMVGEDK